MPETKFGLFPDNGASYVLSRLPGFIGNSFNYLSDFFNYKSYFFYVTNESTPEFGFLGTLMLKKLD